MIRLHHINQSRSLRILWLLEELGQPYDIVSYQRDTHTGAAPDSLKKVHPLGRSPVIELEGQIISESAAITELLIERFAPNRLRPDIKSQEYAKYLQWINFAESSLMAPLFLDTFVQRAGVDDNEFLANYIHQSQQKLLGYLDNEVKGKSFIIANKLSGADFMLSFDLMVLEKRDQLQGFANVKQYARNLAKLDSYQRAMYIEAEHDESR